MVVVWWWWFLVQALAYKGWKSQAEFSPWLGSDWSILYWSLGGKNVTIFYSVEAKSECWIFSVPIIALVLFILEWVLVLTSLFQMGPFKMISSLYRNWLLLILSKSLSTLPDFNSLVYRSSNYVGQVSVEIWKQAGLLSHLFRVRNLTKGGCEMCVGV